MGLSPGDEVIVRMGKDGVPFIGRLEEISEAAAKVRVSCTMTCGSVTIEAGQELEVLPKFLQRVDPRQWMDLCLVCEQEAEAVQVNGVWQFTQHAHEQAVCAGSGAEL